jgi:hypothetical protein
MYGCGGTVFGAVAASPNVAVLPHGGSDELYRRTRVRDGGTDVVSGDWFPGTQY